jgi:alpha-D-xyloside xylohydrolase
MVCPVVDYMYHTPPQATVLIASDYFKTNDGNPGLQAKYYKDTKYTTLGKEQIDPGIDVFWYTGRPDYVTDSMFAIRWEGKLLPKETGKHQFHLKSFDAKRLILNGDTLKMVYTSTEQYTAPVELEAGKEYSIVLETENTSTGAARMQLFWKTPSIFAKEENKEEKEKTKEVYLPANTTWFDFWTGKTYQGGQKLKFDAPKDLIPLLVRAGSIIPMGPFVEYSTQKPADPLELRIYTGADGTFNLYEDENDNYNYEKGIYSTIAFAWNDAAKELTIDARKGIFPGMLENRTIKVVMVKEGSGTGVEISKSFDKEIKYNGEKQVVKFE